MANTLLNGAGGSLPAAIRRGAVEVVQEGTSGQSAPIALIVHQTPLDADQEATLGESQQLPELVLMSSSKDVMRSDALVLPSLSMMSNRLEIKAIGKLLEVEDSRTIDHIPVVIQLRRKAQHRVGFIDTAASIARATWQ